MSDFIVDFIFLNLFKGNQKIAFTALGFFIMLIIILVFVIPRFFAAKRFKKVELYFPYNKIECLHIAEIEIYDAEGKKIELTDDMITMSSLYVGDSIQFLFFGSRNKLDYSKRKMIDNDSNTFAHTNCGAGERISIAFTEAKTISAVKIVNRNSNVERIVGAILSLQVNDTEKIELPITNSQLVYNFTLKNGVLTVS